MRLIVYTFLITVLCASCEEKILSGLTDTQPTIIVGDRYALSFDYDNEDPFKAIKVDTVTVTGLKNGYVQWQYKNGFKISTKEKWFRDWVKPISK